MILEPGIYLVANQANIDDLVHVKDRADWTVGAGCGVPRRQIILDLEDRQRREFVVEILRESHHSWTSAVADQIEAQTKPSKIEEPKQGVRVEANLLGFPTWNKYLHIGTLAEEHWVRLKDGNVYAWDLLTNPEVVTS